jgi:hypothetical protein
LLPILPSCTPLLWNKRVWKLTRNGTSYGKSAAYGRTEPDISSHTKKVVFNQAVFSGRKIIPQTSKPGSDTNMAPGQSGADWTEVFNELKKAEADAGSFVSFIC